MTVKGEKPDMWFEKLRVEINDGLDHEPPICSVFGCGRHLTLEEQRYGSRCINHSIDYEQTKRINEFTDKAMGEG